MPTCQRDGRRRAVGHLVQRLQGTSTGHSSRQASGPRDQPLQDGALFESRLERVVRLKHCQTSALKRTIRHASRSNGPDHKRKPKRPLQQLTTEQRFPTDKNGNLLRMRSCLH
ncbi:hypothetical protein NPIL_267501 [Nephila pilipes]|uniref:Uncharacterized protein n=1 Tax=Nephila pilipes TaxID=299642 RepID=A0A8X6MPY9_NEPPI|nr:hypothetical protein NPIL_267501 [Nephila pilipes]